MQVTFYKNFNKRINSTKRPTGGSVKECYLKNETSIESPTFMIDGIDLEYNYCYAFGHYYFINDIIVSNNNIYEISCTQDVLATYKSAIGSYSAYIERSSSSHDEEIIDAVLPATTHVIKDTQSKFVWTSGTVEGRYYVLGVNGKGAGLTYGATKYYVLEESEFRVLLINLYGNDIWDIVKNSTNPIQYVTSCMRFPVAPPSDGEYHEVRLGDWWCANAYALSQPITVKRGTIPLTKHPQIESHGKWVNTSPFTKYTLHFEPFGSFPLDPGILVNDDKLNYEITVDFISGMGILTVTDDNYGAILVQASAQLASPIEVTQRTINGGQIASAALGAVGAVGAFATGNVGAGVALASVASAAATTFPQFSKSGTNGSICAFELPAQLMSEFSYLAPLGNNVLGRPYCKYDIISNHSGYIKCANASVPITGLANDKDVVNNYLNSGFYYE